MCYWSRAVMYVCLSPEQSQRPLPPAASQHNNNNQPMDPQRPNQYLSSRFLRRKLAAAVV
ncbi:unnamed protein product [Ectocarpus sp. CCAP 1310/34]|nr:unnamed protein product [Ectocarpus sp. CCAP 1310/34]CAB1111272.1 unnamed protein product [Ectocarpus sp. CCAP 1310/34]